MSDARQRREWRAGATRHRVMERVLAVQRHDAMGPLSGVRLALAALGRRAGTGALSAEDLAARLATIQANVATTVQALLAMRVWDGARGEDIPAHRLVADCLRWVRPLATLAQVEVHAQVQVQAQAQAQVASDPGAELGGAGAGAAAAPTGRCFDSAESVDAHYAVLAALLHALDRTPPGGAFAAETTPRGLRVHWPVAASPPAGDARAEADEASAASVAGSQAPADESLPGKPPAQTAGATPTRGLGQDDPNDPDDGEDAVRIDAGGVEALAQGCGWTVVTDADGRGFELTWGA